MLTTLPDSVLLAIFEYLDVRHLSRLSRVCKRFWRLTNDRTLWKDVDLSSFCINLQRLRKLMHVRFPSTMKSLKVRGYAKVYTPRWKTETVSPSLLNELAQHCPGLKSLQLIEVYFSEQTTAAHLPSSVVSLTLTRCNFASYAAWFTEVNVLSLIKFLDLSQCPGITQKALNNIFHWNSLKSLILQDCYIVGNATVKTIAESELQLHLLNVRGTHVTSEALITIGMHMPFLEELYVGGVPGNHLLPDQNKDIDNKALQGFYHLSNLQVLIMCNTVISDDGLKLLYNNKRLRILDVSNTNVSQLACEQFRARFPQCVVVI